VRTPDAARRRTDCPPDPDATLGLPQHFDVGGEQNHGSDGDEVRTPPTDRSQGRGFSTSAAAAKAAAASRRRFSTE